VIPQSSPAHRQVARQFTGSLGRSARALTQTTYVEDLLGELDGFRRATIGELVDLMRRYNLHFGPTEAPEEHGLYQELYPLLVEQRRALGLDTGGTVGRDEARPTSPSSPEVGRQAVGPRGVGRCSHAVNDRAPEDLRLLSDGRIDSRFAGGRWTFDGTTLTLTWPRQDGAPKVSTVRLSDDGTTYQGKNDRDWVVKGVKIPDQP
jgi:hypothetical protein